MDKQFWHDRWQRNEIGFHRDTIHPALERHWQDVSGGNSKPVLVPLCGKSLDMLWLARQGHQVVGVELDRGAVEAFFDDAGLAPVVDETGPLPSFSAGGVTLLAGDFLEFNPLGKFGLVYDRAALIALPSEMRPRYLAHLASLLAPGASGLLIALEYPQTCMAGPPFAVLHEELADAPALMFKCLARDDALVTHPNFAEKGVPSLSEVAYRLTSR